MLEELRRDHGKLRTLLSALETQLVAAQRVGHADYPLMERVLNFLTTFPDGYHHRLEAMLFDRLRIRMPAAEPAVRALAQEFTELHRDGRRLAALLDDIINGQIHRRSTLIEAGTSYISRFRLQMDLEELHIFRHLEKALTTADWQTLRRFHERVTDHGTRRRAEEAYADLDRMIWPNTNRELETMGMGNA
ncbi:hemerythrin domain-containing protein [Methylonatrum kenyense]|uniref:hemerythrin domain-containing protein n=1 Tax=Methylonatrum kenyense TaxID=455253 RepID=UPI0020BE829E|nr:hemerythrin domain-containing protein [Methylonatrum kenyense]MCK8515837.1 hemerythrin domain-containing protein [Methylonatrum kenyense]